jgi:hypothetical protein
MSKMLGTDVAVEPIGPASVPGDIVHGQRDAARLAALFTPEIVLPEQFFEGARRDSYISGEKALMLAILEDGIRCFQEHLRNPRSNPRLLSQQAEEWICAVDYEWPFSFVNVCESLGVNAEALRSALVAWKTKQLADRKAGRPAEEKIVHLHIKNKRSDRELH